MVFFIKNTNLSISISLTALKLVGFWPPNHLSNNDRMIYGLYTCFSFMFLLGIYLIIQVVDLFIIWGDLPMMTGTAFLLFTNMAQAAKIANLLLRRDVIQTIIDDSNAILKAEESAAGTAIVRRCDRQTSRQQLLYFMLTVITTMGWATSAEKNSLPLRAWYPYDTSKSPAYELTYMHQVGALFIAAYLNVGKDTLVTTLIAQCRCRMELLGERLRNLAHGLDIGEMLTPEQEQVVSKRLRQCVVHHQRVLETTLLLQNSFSAPTFAQFTVSLVIICVTAFQLVSQTGNLVRLMSMGTYLLNMMFQVFIYCWQGHQLAEESSEVSVAAYTWPWYSAGTRLRRALLCVMVRTRRVARLSAAGFTTLTLSSFMAIIKASYSLFTLLQQVDEKK